MCIFAVLYTALDIMRTHIYYTLVISFESINYKSHPLCVYITHSDVVSYMYMYMDKRKTSTCALIHCNVRLAIHGLYIRRK